MRPFLDRIQKESDSAEKAERLATASTRLRGCNSGIESRRMPDQGRREFLETLNGKTESADTPLVDVPPAGTSQDRSCCGTRHREALSDQIHRCGGCGLE